MASPPSRLSSGSASTAPAPDALRVALYTRVSTDNQMGDEGSLETQEARLRSSVASRQAPHVVARVFREEGASGKNLDRPRMQEMLAAVRAGQIDVVMVTRLDRLSRSLLDFYELHRAFEAKNVQFVSLNESFDTSQPIGRAMLKLVLVFAVASNNSGGFRPETMAGGKCATRGGGGQGRALRRALGGDATAWTADRTGATQVSPRPAHRPGEAGRT